MATIRRLPRTPVEELDALVVEVLGEDGTLRTGSLAEEAGILVDAGVTSAEHARFFVPGYA